LTETKATCRRCNWYKTL